MRTKCLRSACNNRKANQSEYFIFVHISVDNIDCVDIDDFSYTFYDGPPFATGLPHYGHILAGTIKDVVTRYAHQQGYHVERRFGWDCHGLPVEYEIDKTLNIRGPEDVAKMGIAAYNNECRKIVMRYANEWEQVVNRMGRWIGEKDT